MGMADARWRMGLACSMHRARGAMKRRRRAGADADAVCRTGCYAPKGLTRARLNPNPRLRRAPPPTPPPAHLRWAATLPPRHAAHPNRAPTVDTVSAWMLAPQALAESRQLERCPRMKSVYTGFSVSS